MLMRKYGLTLDGAGYSLKDALLITAAGFLIITLLGYFIGFKVPQINTGWLLFYMLISVPVQELVFRGFVQTYLYRYGRFTAIIIASVLYGAIHFQNLLLAFLAAIAGTAWGYSFSKNPTLTGPIVSHAVLGVYLFLFVV